MRSPRSLICASVPVIAAYSSLVFAQAAAPPPPAGFDPEQFPAIRGEFERLTLTPRGDIDGLILKDGTEVKIAPELGEQIAFALKPGDRVTVHGLKAAALPLVRAVSITDEVTHRTVIDTHTIGDSMPPRVATPRRAPTHLLGTTHETSGTVRMALHGAQGEVNGVLLESGTLLRFPPDQAMHIAAAIQPRQTVVAEGIVTTNALGTVVDVQQLGASRDRMVAVGPPLRPIDATGPAGPRRLPPEPKPQPQPQPEKF